MAVNKPDLSAMGRDLVMKTLDGVAEKYGSGDSVPDAVRQLATKWKSMSDSDRDDMARHVSMAVQGALSAVMPLAAAAVSRVRSKKKKPSAATPSGAAAVMPAEKAGKKEKKAKKKDKKEKKDKDRKKKKKR